MKRSKYNAKPVVIDGLRFASTKEGNRYKELKLLEMVHQIKGLRTQPKYPIYVNGIKICNYIADFEYLDGFRCVVEDVKGVKTPIYRLKKKLVEAIYAIKITEV